ncbi:MAG: tetratricopeptide repeat protein, partial [Phycisphaerae bacterium]|nr:tetratricopeptide repeat protein [Phycisphaerae bacterium]
MSSTTPSSSNRVSAWLNSPSPVRDALLTGVVAAACLVGILFVPGWWAKVAIGIGIVVFVLRLYFHPAFWWRRLVSSVLFTWATATAVPQVTVEAQWAPQTFGRFIVGEPGSSIHPWFCAAFIASVLACAYCETRKGHGPTAPTGATNRHSTRIGPQVGTIIANKVVFGDEAPTPSLPTPPDSPQTSRAPASPQWPAPWIKPLAKKPVDHFVGRTAELRQLRTALKSKTPVALIIGLAGQGKSSILTVWHDRGAAPPNGVGLFWCRAYEAKYTFGRFLEDLRRYLTGQDIDRQALPRRDQQLEHVLDLLQHKPSWIIVDGAERWLKRWTTNPDADVIDPTEDDRLGAEDGVDDFLTEASTWTNRSRLILTTRALPTALNLCPHTAIGTICAHEKTLHGLGPGDAVDLFTKLDITGDQAEMMAAAAAYKGHAYSLQLLGHALATAEYGSDIANWTKVDPIKGDLSNVLAKLVDHFPDERPLLDLVACSLGPAPVGMLAELLKMDSDAIRDHLRRLAEWQLLEFAGGDAVDVHAVVRTHLRHQLGEGSCRERARVLAQWWAAQPVPPNPKTLDELQPRLTAVDHAIDAGDPELSVRLLNEKHHADSPNDPQAWLRDFGLLDESSRLNARIIQLLTNLVKREGRDDLLSAVANHHAERGITLRGQGKHEEAVSDYNKAIAIYDTVAKEEERTDLASKRANCYICRGLALVRQGKFDDAVNDHSKAIQIYHSLIEKKRQTHLALFMPFCYICRAVVLRVQGKLDNAIDDHNKALEICDALVKKEGRTLFLDHLANCHSERGITLRIQGKLDNAIDDHNKALEICD